MGCEQDRFFAQLESVLHRLSTDGSIDNESVRHDLLIRPMLCSPVTLGWAGHEVLPQRSIAVGPQVQRSYYWRGGVPRQKRPDLIIVPYGLDRTIAVVEEKTRQAGIDALNSHLGQLKEYQYLHSCVWGLLTDGEKWTLQRNNEVLHCFSSLLEVKRHLADLQECIGRRAVVQRLLKHGTADLVVARASPMIVIVATATAAAPPSLALDYLRKPSPTGNDLMRGLSLPIRQEGFQCARTALLPEDVQRLVHSMYGSNFMTVLMGVLGYSELSLLSTEQMKRTEYTMQYADLMLKWLHCYHTLDAHLAECLRTGKSAILDLVPLFAGTETPLYGNDVSQATLKEIVDHPMFQYLTSASRENILWRLTGRHGQQTILQ